MNQPQMRITVETIPLFLSCNSSINLFEDIVCDLPYYAFQASKVCNKQASIASVKLLSALLETTIEGASSYIGPIILTSNRKLKEPHDELRVFHPVAHKLKMIIEQYDQAFSSGGKSIQLQSVENLLTSLKSLLIKLSDESSKHRWDANSLKTSIAICEGYSKYVTH